jgi:hypothetical protein
MQPLGLVFSFDHLTSALFCLGPPTSLNAPSLADPRCRPFSADHTRALLPLLPDGHHAPCGSGLGANGQSPRLISTVV